MELYLYEVIRVLKIKIISFEREKNSGFNPYQHYLPCCNIEKVVYVFLKLIPFPYFWT